MPFVAGIDQSVRHTGICVLTARGEIAALTLVEPPKELTGTDLLVFVRDGVAETLAPFDLQVVVMEGYSYNSVNRKFDLGEIGGTIKLVVADKKSALYVAAPKQLKKFVTSRATASKSDVINAIESQYKETIKNDNLADSYGLARIALEIAAPTSKNRHQIDVVKMITKQSLNSVKRRSRVKGLSDAI